LAKPINRNQLFQVNNRPLVSGQLVRIPISGEQNIPNSLGFNSIEITVGLSTAIKQGVGNTLEFNICQLPGDTFIAGFTALNPWISYGHQITVASPEGGLKVNPDPAFMANITGLTDVHILYRYTGDTPANASLSINGISS